ncbi:MAG: helix-turn-helix domain-containing protein [Bacillota bacterium]|nr:helix-turn-helix domain-containing protein [Bacillota bacterium]
MTTTSTLLTIREVAGILRCSRSFVYELIYTRRLKAIKLSKHHWRISEDALRKILQEQENVQVVKKFPLPAPYERG